MTGKTLYPEQSKGMNTGEHMSSTYSSRQRIPIYTSDSFMGREAVENRNATRGMTDWIAKNFELLNLGQAPYESRQVDSRTRARWQQFTTEVLEAMDGSTCYSARHTTNNEWQGWPYIHDVPSPKRRPRFEPSRTQWRTALCTIFPYRYRCNSSV